MSNKKMIIIVAIALALVIAIGVTAVVVLTGGKEPAEVNYDDLPKFYHEITDLYSNIKDSSRICKVNATIEIVDETLATEIKDQEFVIRDAINLIIRSSTEEQLLGEEGQLYLQDEIKLTLNEKFDTDMVTNVYFKQLIIQG